MKETGAPEIHSYLRTKPEDCEALAHALGDTSAERFWVYPQAGVVRRVRAMDGRHAIAGQPWPDAVWLVYEEDLPNATNDRQAAITAVELFRNEVARHCSSSQENRALSGDALRTPDGEHVGALDDVWYDSDLYEEGR